MKPGSFLAVAALALGACATPPKEPPPKPFAGTRWQLTLELPLAGEQPYLRFGDGRMEGFGGCNRLSARYVQDTVGARAIAIGRIERGTRSCDAAAQVVEQRTIEVLQAVSSYSVSGDLLVMTGSGGTLRFKADAPAGAAAGAAGTSPAGTSLAGTRWTGSGAGAADRAPRLEFSEGRVSGFTGCNMMSGPWEAQGGEARLGAIAATKRLCVGPEGEVERRVLAAVTAEARLRREGRRLVVEGPDGARYEFEQAP